MSFQPGTMMALVCAAQQTCGFVRFPLTVSHWVAGKQFSGQLRAGERVIGVWH
jgi:hypothetical protein